MKQFFPIFISIIAAITIILVLLINKTKEPWAMMTIKQKQTIYILFGSGLLLLIISGIIILYLIN